MLTQHASTPLVSRGTRFLLILMGLIVVTACSWTNLLSQPDSLNRVEIPEVAPPIETLEPLKTPVTDDVDQSDRLSGKWVGQALLNDGTQLYYELEVFLDGTQVTGTSRATNEDGAATVNVRGTYEDGLLELEEYGGQAEGGWESICYWTLRLRLRTRGAAGAIRLVGSFEDIPNIEDTCTAQGELTLTQQ